VRQNCHTHTHTHTTTTTTLTLSHSLTRSLARSLNPHRYLGCHALLLNCANLTIGNGLFSSNSVYVLAGTGTTATLRTEPVAVGLTDGWVTTPGVAPAVVPLWLVQQAALVGVNASSETAGRNSHVYLNLTSSVSLPDATDVHIFNLGGHTALLEANNATRVTVSDVVPWNGTVDVQGSTVHEPAGRYVISFDGTSARQMVRVLIAAYVDHINITCPLNTPALVNWTFTNSPTLNVVAPIEWQANGCIGALSSVPGRSTVSTLTSNGPVTLSYSGVSVSNVASARVAYPGSFVMSANCNDVNCTAPQWSSRGVTIGAASNVTATLRRLDRAPWGGPAPMPGIDISAMPTGLLVLTAEGALVFNHVPSFSYSDEVVSFVETTRTGPYCVSERMCTADAWEGGYADAVVDSDAIVCLSAADESDCERTAVGVVLHLPTSAAHSMECSGDDGTGQITLSAVDGGRAPSPRASVDDSRAVSTDRTIVSVMFAFAIIVPSLLALELRTAYMWSALWLLAPMWSCTPTVDRQHYASNEVYVFDMQVQRFTSHLGGQEICSSTGVGLVGSPAVIITASATWGVVSALLVALVIWWLWSRRVGAGGAGSGGGDAARFPLVGSEDTPPTTLLSTLMAEAQTIHLEFAWRDQSILAAPRAAAVHRIVSVLALCLFFVLYVPVAAQFAVDVRAVAGALLFLLVLFVARPSVDPAGTAGYCGIPVATRVFAVSSSPHVRKAIFNC
jgi:hypothetical protein